jgi:hypothetical protein
MLGDKMRRLPANIIRILEEAPRRCPKRANVMGMVQWRLERGMTFTSQELVQAAKKRTTKRFVESALDSLILQRVIVRLPDKSYAACESNNEGVDAALLKFAEENRHFTRRDVWMKMPSSMTERNLDRMLKRMLDSGVLRKAHRGTYVLASADIADDPVAPKPRRKAAKPTPILTAVPDIECISKAA